MKVAHSDEMLEPETIAVSERRAGTAHFAVDECKVENLDQIALRKWIEAGLSIPEVRSLNGGAKWLFPNMIAKYTLAADYYEISKAALAEFRNRKTDLSIRYTRGKFKPSKENKTFYYEHAIPASVVFKQLYSSDCTAKSVRDTLDHAGPVVVLLQAENDRLDSAGFKAEMPTGWKYGDDPYARYKEVGIEVSQEVLLVHGRIYR